MLVSAPFDDWWHNAYGLDVKIISPPHMVLAAGFFGIELGTIMLLLAFMNRAGTPSAPHAAVAVPVRRRHGGLRVAAPQDGIHQPLRPCTRRSSTSSSRIGTPAILIAVAVASRQRWALHDHGRRLHARSALAFLWILPLFPAEPKLGPVYHQVTHFIPWEFPLLLIVPALAIDLICQRTGRLAADGARRSIAGAGVSRRRSSPCSGRSRIS